MDERRNFTLDEAVDEAEAAFRRANPGSAAAHERSLASMPGGNTRTVLHYSPFPLVFARGEGARLTDVDGHVYTDFLGEYTAGLFGHSQPAILAAIKRALDDGFVMGGPTRLEEAFARTLCERFPAMDQVRFCNSGTEANLLAFGAARAWTGRDVFIVLEGCYHGGVLSFGSDSPINAPYVVRKIRLNDIDGARAAIRDTGDRLAGVMLEPMLGGGGGFPATPEFMAVLREETAALGALLMVDEVMTSRLAPGGLHTTLGVEVDLMTLGKYIGGGMSFGAVGGRGDIMERFDPRRPDAWGHAGTFNNNVATMGGGLAAMTEVLTPEALADLNARGDRLRGKLNAMARGDRHSPDRDGLRIYPGLSFLRPPRGRAARVAGPASGSAHDRASGPDRARLLLGAAGLHRTVAAVDRRGRGRLCLCIVGGAFTARRPDPPDGRRCGLSRI